MPGIFGTFSLPVPEGSKVTLHPLEKTSVATTDQSLLDAVQTKEVGDIAVITTTIEGTEWQKTAYMWNGTQWVALNGNVEADKVILTDDIVMAGNYTQIGNLTKTSTGTATFEVKGKTLMEALTEIMSKRLQPNTPTKPSVAAFTFSPNGVVECGTTYESISINAPTFNPGSYQYGPATGITPTGWTLERVASTGTENVASVAGPWTDEGTGGFTIGDQSGDISSLRYRATAAYGEGAVANDNLGSPSNPEVKISAGSASAQSSSSITAYRAFFYGAVTSDPPGTVDSAYVRGFTKSTSAASNGKTFNITIPEGAKTVIIAYPATFHDLTSVKDVNAFGTDIVASFVKQTVQVEGANGYQAIDYKVFIYNPAAALGANTYNVTI